MESGNNIVQWQSTGVGLFTKPVEEATDKIRAELKAAKTGFWAGVITGAVIIMGAHFIVSGSFNK